MIYIARDRHFFVVDKARAIFMPQFKTSLYLLIDLARRSLNNL